MTCFFCRPSIFFLRLPYGILMIGTTLAFCSAYAETKPQDDGAVRLTDEKERHEQEYIEVVGVRQPRRLDQTGTGGQSVTRSQLRQEQVRDTNDLGRVLPGLQILNTGDFLFPAITVRGIASAQDPYRPATTFYVDNVPVLPVNAMQALLDVDNVQFLRGPQVALYGQSAEGGVIDITTRQPGKHTHSSFEAGAESRYGYHVTGSVDGTLIRNWLYGTIAMTSQQQQGNLANPATGARRFGGYESRGGRAGLRLSPDDRPWEFNFSIDGACSYGSQDVYVNFHNLRTRKVSSAVSGTPNPRLSRCGHNESLRGIYHLDGWKLSAITSWQDSDISRMFPYYSYISTQPEQWRANTQELRFGTEKHHHFYDVVTGFYHQTIYQNRNSQIAATMPRYMPYALTASHNRAGTVALYGNIYWHLLKTLDLGMGGRLSRDMAHIAFGSTYGGQSLFAGNKHRNQNMSLGNVSLDYEALPGWHLHGRVSQGYKPAGFNYAPTNMSDANSYNPERELSYEIGTVYRQENFLACAGYFYNHLQDEQVYVGPAGYQTIASAARAHASGVEGELRWAFLPGWVIGADGNRTASKFDHFNDGASRDYGGLHMPYVPQFMAAGHLSARFQTRFGRIEPGLDLRITGPQYFDIANELRQPAYMQLDLHTTWSFGSHYEVMVYANNVTDKLYRTYAFTGPMGDLAQISFGRTVGFNLRIATGENRL